MVAHKKNRYIVNRILYVLITCLCIIAFILCFSLCDFHNRIELDNAKANDTISALDAQKEAVVARLDEINAIPFDVDEKNREMKELNDEIESISTSYVNQFKVQQLNDNFINMICRHFYISIDDYSIYRDQASKIEGELQNTSEKITVIDETKEDVANKQNDAIVTSNDNYLSSLGLSNEFKNLFDKIYPVGSIYISINGTMPAIGSWQQLPTKDPSKASATDYGLTLWNTDTGGGGYISPTLPNVYGSAGCSVGYNVSGATPFILTQTGHNSHNYMGGTNYGNGKMYMNVHNINSTYQDNATVRPASYFVAMFKRVS